uniref:Sterile alpha motif domain containing 11 n=1 Tax=Ficedula albicollis TaxID=59894 RepID=A0A803W8C3_FICAL
MSKGILQVHPPICDCPGCRISSPVNRGRLAEKRTIPLPPSRVPKKELSSIFSHSEDSQESDKSNGQHPEVKQEEDLHISIMKRRIHTHWDLNISFRETSCSRDSELSTIISSLQQSRQLVMPESQSRCEFKRSSLDVGLAAADEILGKRRVCSPNSSSECPLESKKARSESPKETSQTAALEEAAAQMTPEEHYRRMVAALGEHGSFEEQQQQRLYQLGISGGCTPGWKHSSLCSGLGGVLFWGCSLVLLPPPVPAARAQDGLAGSRAGSVPSRLALFSDCCREISHPPPLLSPQNAPHIALGPHLRPPFLGVPSALCQTPGYGFLQPAQAEMFARQQEMLRKQNLARLEMSAELLRQKELETLHRQRLLAAEPLSLHPALPPEHPALRSAHEAPEGPALRDELSRRSAMLVLDGEDKAEGSKGEAQAEPKEGKDGAGKACEGGKEPGEAAAPGAGPCSSSSAESPSHLLGPGISKAEVKYLPPASLPAPQPLPLGFPYTVSPYFHTGTMGGLFLDGEESPALEDISKWTVEDVCSFVSNLSGCTEYTQVFREQAIDGETLPLLTEEHLLNNMGLKLGPALKIRSQVGEPPPSEPVAPFKAVPGAVRAVAVTAHPWAQGHPQVPKSQPCLCCAGTMSDSPAFPEALPVYEGAHKKGLWAIVPHGSIQEEIKFLCSLKNKRTLSSSEMGLGAGAV